VSEADKTAFVVAFLLVVCVVIGAACGFSSGRECGSRMLRQEAIDHGCAEWRVDPKTGATEFVWLKAERE
jgi:hypothetical protein